MFKWKKLGQVFDLSQHSNNDWMEEQAQNPFVLEFKDFIRVYFNTREKKDEKGLSKSLPSFVDLDKDNFSKVLNLPSEKIIKHGNTGDFDEFGIMAGAVIKIKENYNMYYVGWTRKVSVPYDWSIGLAQSIDGVNFKRLNKGPIISNTNKEPFLQAGCSSIFKENGIYSLFYTSGIKWIENGDEKPESMYQIMQATSIDGVHWERNSEPIISSIVDNESQASPSVIKNNGVWHMVFSYRYSVDFRNKERGYRLGYATSNDLKTWKRNDGFLNISVSEKGWDSEMVCYPHITKINNKVYLFYCGNDFGRYGFGVAELIE
mgnify:CR=1 FL=1